VSPPTTASEGSQNEAGQTSPTYTTGHVSTDCRPIKLEYSSNLSSEGGYSTQGGNSIYSPSSPLIHSQTPSSTTPSSSTTPVAAPRLSIKVKQLEEEKLKLQNERDLLEKENSELSGRVSMLKEANERNLKKLNKEKDRINEENERNIDKIARLELSGVSADFEKDNLKLQLKEKDDQIDKEQQERRMVESSLGCLRIDYERIEREMQRLEEERDRLRVEVKKSPSVEQTAPLGRAGGRDTGIHRRFTEAVREKRELQEVCSYCATVLCALLMVLFLSDI
jgi:DNA repair exonuclease SbcCD ATPase subunit